MAISGTIWLIASPFCASGFVGEQSHFNSDCDAILLIITACYAFMPTAKVERRIDILKRLSSLSESHRNILVTDIEQFAERCNNIEERTEIWKALRALLSKHRQFPDAQWVLPSKELDRLETIYLRLEPEDEVLRFAWLFENNWPEFPDGRPEDHDDFQKRVAESRCRALIEIYRIGGIESLSRLVIQAEQVYFLGLHAAEAFADPEVENWVLDKALGNDDNCLSRFALAFVERRQFTHKNWFDKKLEQALAERWEANKLVQLCLALSLNMKTWKRVENLGDEVKRNYWAAVNIWRLNSEDEVVEYALAQLLLASRPEAALELIRFKDKITLPFALTANALELLFVKLTSETNNTIYPRSYEIDQVFSAMDSAIDKDEQRIAQLEWHFLPFLKDSERGRGPKVLHQALNDDPLFFAQALSWIFKPENGVREDEGLPHEALSNRAHLAHDLLESWEGLPGYADSMIVEKVLTNWVNQARERLITMDRKCLGEQYIGQVLSRSPIDNDGLWPAVPVRKIIESLRSHDLEEGVYLGVFNSRGFTSRSFGDGGNQERGLEVRYRDWAERTAISWPMTSRMLHMIANSYASHAKDYDMSSARDELRFG